MVKQMDEKNKIDQSVERNQTSFVKVRTRKKNSSHNPEYCRIQNMNEFVADKRRLISFNHLSNIL